MTPLEAYLTALREIRSSGESVVETSFYPALINLLDEIGKSLKPKVRCISQLKNRGAGSPDLGLFTEDQLKKDQLKKRGKEESLPQNPARGVIEIKPTSSDAWLTADGEQVSRYWGKYRQVLVTNYRDFVFVGQDATGRVARRFLASLLLPQRQPTMRVYRCRVHLGAIKRGCPTLGFVRVGILTLLFLAE
jgi:hypothetical protein